MVATSEFAARHSARSTGLRAGRMRRQRLQAEALERLIAVLEVAASQAAGENVSFPPRDPERPNRMARLQAAHAAYALASSPMRRAGVGGWMCGRHRRTWI